MAVVCNDTPQASRKQPLGGLRWVTLVDTIHAAWLPSNSPVDFAFHTLPASATVARE
ncbi:hypothetical protein KQI52_03090 [bacterium]|nr:hypothetical protein [bacterium]